MPGQIQPVLHSLFFVFSTCAPPDLQPTCTPHPHLLHPTHRHPLRHLPCPHHCPDPNNLLPDSHTPITPRRTLGAGSRPWRTQTSSLRAIMFEAAIRADKMSRVLRSNAPRDSTSTMQCSSLEYMGLPVLGFLEHLEGLKYRWNIHAEVQMLSATDLPTASFL